MNIDITSIGNNIKHYRKLKKISLQDLGKIIFKTKGTISKYEKGTIVLDVLTLIDISKALDVNVNQLLENSNLVNTSANQTINFSKTNILYIYYYSKLNKKLKTSILEIFNDNKNYSSTRFFNNITNYNNYRKNYEYCYSGNLIMDNTITYVSLTNDFSKHIQLEKIEIIINIPWTKEFHITNGLLMALTPNAIPVSFKIIVSDKIINNKKKIIEKLELTKSDLKNIKEANIWRIEPEYLDEYFDE